METIGERIRARRQALGISMQHLGDRIGVTKEAIGKIERGDTKLPTPTNLRKIATELGVDQNWLLDGGEAEVREPESAYALSTDPRKEAFWELFDWLTDEQKDELFRDLEKKKRANKQALEQLAKRMKSAS